MTDASRFLIDLAGRVAEAHRHHPNNRAAMISGSAAKGIADNFSDIDMMLYYEESVPEEEWLLDVRAGLGAPDRKWLVENRDEGSVMEAYVLGGVEVQIIHTTFEATDAAFDEVLVALNVDTPLHKALEGTLASRALYGGELIERFKERARAYPPELAEAMVRHHLNFFPLWGFLPSIAERDAALWVRSTLVESAQNIMGVLAGLNRLYFTTFQFKHMRMVIDAMRIAPADLAARLERLVNAPFAEALGELESLAGDVVALVREHMPSVDTEAAARRIGWRQQPWGIA